MSINDQFTVFWSEWFEAFLTNRNGLKTISSWADPANSVLFWYYLIYYLHK